MSASPEPAQQPGLVVGYARELPPRPLRSTLTRKGSGCPTPRCHPRYRKPSSQCLASGSCLLQGDPAQGHSKTERCSERGEDRLRWGERWRRFAKATTRASCPRERHRPGRQRRGWWSCNPSCGRRCFEDGWFGAIVMREETGRLKFGGMTLRRGGGGRQGRTGETRPTGVQAELPEQSRGGAERTLWAVRESHSAHTRH